MAYGALCSSAAAAPVRARPHTGLACMTDRVQAAGSLMKRRTACERASSALAHAGAHPPVSRGVGAN